MAERSADFWGSWHAAGPEAPVEGADGDTAAQQQRAADTPANAAGQQAGSDSDWRSSWSSSNGWNDESWRSRSWWNWGSSDWHHKESYGYSAKRGKDDDVPTWDGKTLPLKTYFRKIDIWLVGTRMEPELRGVKLLEKLTGDAFDKLELVDPKTLYRRDGVEQFKKLVWDKYEPMERHRVGRVMDKFLEEFSRKYDEEIMDYNTRFDKELAEAEKVAGRLEETWKAHLYIKKMRLKDDKFSLLRTASLGEYTLDAFKKAALSTFPSA